MNVSSLKQRACFLSERECLFAQSLQLCAVQSTFLFCPSPHVDIISSQWKQKWRSLLHFAMITQQDSGKVTAKHSLLFIPKDVFGKRCISNLNFI